MSRCARCGLPESDLEVTGSELCSSRAAEDDDSPDSDFHIIACRDRQIAAQAALLRSVTGKLEEAATRLGEIDNVTCGEVSDVLDTVNSVLELLS